MVSSRALTSLLAVFAVSWVLVHTAFAQAPAPAASAAPHASASSHTPPNEDDGAEGDENPYTAPSSSAAPLSHGPPRPVLPFKDGMLRLPGGRFTMGSSDKASPPNERPAHSVTVPPFWIDRTEVTVAAYRACVDRKACPRPAKSSPSCTYDLDDAELPVSCVHWQDADTYCRSVQKRLPHEAEWEFAARGARIIRFPWGGWGASCSHATTLLHDATGRGCTRGRPSRVGAHPSGASEWGVVDLSGNVEEWTSDWYAETVTEGAAPRSGASHVLRGGGWLSSPSACRTTSRNWGSSVEAGANVGFRCARDD